ncbi:hypothetical protein [Schumannella sp. 10F1B-5-1]|uniref:hypothetical protein n=1 Tax=Schumannella sp. 10F1B-5-1 TaxID=2590780 RepID=UPI001130A6EE|nr:hypothetical protein [Schumannella sp. 10F1B-5-1]TPW78300.1 hypothetical protein FJ658_00380 [Schumannella sp. 10F1B-5-1]
MSATTASDRGRVPTRALATAALVVALLAVGSGAWAFWSTSGSAGGAASSGAGSTVELTPATATADLLPGGTTSVRATATSGSGAVRIPSLKLGAAGITVDAAHRTACPASNFAFTPSSTGWDVAATGSTAITLPGALGLSASAPSGCQGAVATVALAVGS